MLRNIEPTRAKPLMPASERSLPRRDAFGNLLLEVNGGASRAVSRLEAPRPRHSAREAHIGKRMMDVGLITLSLPVILPVIGALWLIVRLDGGAGFFRQKRLGADGRVFDCLKLRTMVPDAEARLKQAMAQDPDLRREWTVHQKLKYDPRITRVGQFLRRSSLDELPQLWNVLRGEMSLVGPRPMMPEQAALYPGPIYFGHTPGITGLWQVTARHMTSFAARAHYDRIYARKASLKTDISLLFKTVRAVVKGTGA